LTKALQIFGTRSSAAPEADTASDC